MRLVILAAAAALALLLPSPDANAATANSAFNVCAALRGGTSLASIESTLTARGYSEHDAGAFTGAEVRDHCPDMRANVVAQVRAAGA